MNTRSAIPLREMIFVILLCTYTLFGPGHERACRRCKTERYPCFIAPKPMTTCVGRVGKPYEAKGSCTLLALPCLFRACRLQTAVTVPATNMMRCTRLFALFLVAAPASPMSLAAAVSAGRAVHEGNERFLPEEKRICHARGAARMQKERSLLRFFHRT